MKQELKNYALGLNASDVVVAWIEKRVKGKEPVSEVEHIIDYLISDKAPKRLDRATYKQMKSNAEKWNNTLIKKGGKIKETDDSVETVIDFGDGFKVVKLIEKEAYDREGFLMRHCVASYFGKDKEIYSLRDSDNQPHCTIEKDNQIKGKGNGDIHPKYIDYVVRFLEFTGMKVRDSEMEHLGYIVPKFKKHIKNKLYKDKYLRKTEEIAYNNNVIIFDSIDNVMKYTGDKLVLFSGDVYVCEGGTFSAPLLTECGDVDVCEGGTFSAPLLTECGDVYVREGGTFSAPLLTECGDVDVREGGTFSAPLLTECGNVYVRKGGTFSAPLLKRGKKWNR
jgi:hypothetical protein